MSDLAIYQPTAPSLGCSLFALLDSGFGYMQPVGVGIGAILSLKETFAPLFSHVQINTDRSLTAQLITPSVSKTLLVASAIGKPLLSYTYQMQCGAYDSKVQLKMKEISKLMISVVERHRNLPQSCTTLRKNFKEHYENLALWGSNSKLLDCAHSVLQKALPTEKSLQKSSLSLREAKLYFESLNEHTNPTKKISSKVIQDWIKLLDYYN